MTDRPTRHQIVEQARYVRELLEDVGLEPTTLRAAYRDLCSAWLMPWEKAGLLEAMTELEEMCDSRPETRQCEPLNYAAADV